MAYMLSHPPLRTSTAWQSDECLNAWGLIFVLQGLPWEHCSAQGLTNLVPRVSLIFLPTGARGGRKRRDPGNKFGGLAAWLASILILESFRFEDEDEDEDEALCFRHNEIFKLFHLQLGWDNES